MCQAFCASNNYALAGVEYSSECYCGMDLANGATYGQTGCNMPCSGNGATTCGGPARLDVYKNTSFVYPVAVPAVDNLKLQGCYVDSPSARVLGKSTWVSWTSMTAEGCVAYCQSENYAVAGVEYSAECYCDSAVPSNMLKAPLTDCTKMLCTGSLTEYCGYGNRILVYA